MLFWIPKKKEWKLIQCTKIQNGIKLKQNESSSTFENQQLWDFLDFFGKVNRNNDCHVRQTSETEKKLENYLKKIIFCHCKFVFAILIVNARARISSLFTTTQRY